MVKITSTTGFASFAEDFIIDTGKNFEDNMELYTQYAIARLLQKNNDLLLKLLNHTASLPQDLAFQLKGN
jgi:hypothetical protein